MSFFDCSMPGFYSQDRFQEDLRRLDLASAHAVTLTDIKRQRDRLLQFSHPDLGGSHDEAQEIISAYSRLRTRLQREAERQSILRNIRRGLGAIAVVGTGIIFAARRRHK